MFARALELNAFGLVALSVQDKPRELKLLGQTGRTHNEEPEAAISLFEVVGWIEKEIYAGGIAQPIREPQFPSNVPNLYLVVKNVPETTQEQHKQEEVTSKCARQIDDETFQGAANRGFGGKNLEQEDRGDKGQERNGHDCPEISVGQGEDPPDLNDDLAPDSQ
jgi:hypothetical protein